MSSPSSSKERRLAAPPPPAPPPCLRSRRRVCTPPSSFPRRPPPLTCPLLSLRTAGRFLAFPASLLMDAPDGSVWATNEPFVELAPTHGLPAPTGLDALDPDEEVLQVRHARSMDRAVSAVSAVTAVRAVRAVTAV